MKQRTPQQVGVILKRRRDDIGLEQDRLVYVSASTARKIEKGDPVSTKYLGRYVRALRWPSDAYERLIRGEDPATLPDAPDPLYDRLSEPTATDQDLLPDLLGELRRLTKSVDGVRKLVQEQWDDLRQRSQPPTGPGRRAKP